ncbi:MAG: DUF4149 domain-containing protein [Deltaproteobacteria bacterium]|nr:DUF4149 domain-containing protein [Deltaproteobacteria bacterium]
MTKPRRLALVIVAFWLGVMLTLACSVAVAVFSVVGQETGGRIMQRIFPFIYTVSLVCPAAALALVLRQAARSARRLAMLAPLGLALAVAACNAFLLAPRISAARKAMDAADGAARDTLTEAFGRLHLLSVWALGALIVLALAYVLMEVLAPREVRARG